MHSPQLEPGGPAGTVTVGGGSRAPPTCSMAASQASTGRSGTAQPASEARGRAGRPQAECWKHFKVLSKKGNNAVSECNYCGVVLRGSATRLSAHLAGVKGASSCVTVPEEVRQAFKASLEAQQQPAAGHPSLQGALLRSFPRAV